MSTLSGGPNIVVDGLVLYLDAANRYSYVSGSTTWRDLSRSNNNGTLINGPTFNTGSGGSIVFDGIDDYVISNLTKTQIGNNLTLNIWIKFNDLQTNKGILQIADNLNDGVPWILLQRTTNTSIRWYLDGNYRITNNIDNLKYFNLTLTYDGTVWIVYVNSIPNGSYTGGLGSYSGNFTWLGNGYNGYSSCNISQTLIYNRALSSQEILQNYNATKTRFGL
jgi:hypothetical protein